CNASPNLLHKKPIPVAQVSGRDSGRGVLWLRWCNISPQSQCFFSQEPRAFPRLGGHAAAATMPVRYIRQGLTVNGTLFFILFFLFFPCISPFCLSYFLTLWQLAGLPSNWRTSPASMYRVPLFCS